MAFTIKTRYGAMESYSDDREIQAVVESLIREHGDEPLALIDRQTNERYIVVRAAVFTQLKKLLEDEEDRNFKKDGSN